MRPYIDDQYYYPTSDDPFSGIPYGRFLDTSIGRVSIDNLRVKFTLPGQYFDYEEFKPTHGLTTIWRALQAATNHPDVLPCFCTLKEFPCFKIGCYAATMTFQDWPGDTNDWSFAVLLGRYDFHAPSKTNKVVSEAVLDINPNKVPYRVISGIVRVLLHYALSYEIVRFDLAVDLLSERNSLTLVERSGSDYKLFETSKGRTEYIGKRSAHAGIKLYDKGREHNLPYSCTRCEMTLEPKKYTTISKHFPKIVSNASPEFDPTVLPFPVLAMLKHPDLISDFKAVSHRHTFDKYMKMLQAITDVCYRFEEPETVDTWVHTILDYYTSGLRQPETVAPEHNIIEFVQTSPFGDDIVV